MASETTHPSLLSRVRATDDQEAWRDFDEKYRELIVRYARARGVQPADAEDVRQLVMVGLSRALTKFQYRPEIGRFRDYLRRAVRNAIHKTLSCQRSERQALWDEELIELAGADPDEPDDAWEREWMHHHFRQAMRRASASFAPESLAIFSDLSAGIPVETVCESHGVRRDAVYKTKQRIRDALRALIAEQIRDEEFAERGRES